MEITVSTVVNTEEPSDPVVEFWMDGPHGPKNIFYSLEGIPEIEWEFTITAMRREALDKYGEGKL